jgi:dTDP-6-deoxy-L-talose 4-dehydrogenase (NAD+)
MKLAISGASGFIGRHVLTELRRRGLGATLACRPTVPLTPALEGFALARMDLLEPPADAWERLGCPDTLLHLAWGGLPNYRSERHLRVELPAQRRFLRGLVDAGLKYLVVTGTCFEYGMQSNALSEDLPVRPENCYGQAKDALRRSLQAWQVETDPPRFGLTWARLFYTWGEGQAPNSLWMQLRTAVERGVSRFDMSGGEQLRDYLPVARLAEHLVTLTLAPQPYDVVNLCSGTPVSVRSLVEGWCREQGWPIALNLGHYPYPDHEPMRFWGDAAKLQRCLARAQQPTIEDCHA